MRIFIVAIIALLGALPVQVLWHWTQPHPDLAHGRPRPQIFDPALWYHLIDVPGFAVGYSEWLRNPLWVAWAVPEGPLQPLQPRPRRFACAAGTLVRVCPEDYTRSGFDRGHLAPNYAMSRLHGRAAQLASFSMINIAPQRRTLNAQAWQRLEEIEMDHLRREPGQSLYVLTGPVFARHPPRLPSGVAIPEAFWRLWVRGAGEQWQAVAFLLPQDAPADADLRDFMLSVDALEARIGLDLLHRLPDRVERQLEADFDAREWADDAVWTQPGRYTVGFFYPSWPAGPVTASWLSS